MSKRNDLRDTVESSKRPGGRRTALREVRLAVHGLGCTHCSEVVKKALLQLPGVEMVHIDLYQSAGTVRFDPSVTDIEDVLLAVQQAGEGGAHRYWADPLAGPSSREKRHPAQ